jgi:uncharacterized repeat protein (TIGR01451 family)
LLGSVTASGPQAIDDAAGRGFYLAQKGSTWEIRAYDLATLQPAGTQTVANVLGTPGNLIRCGADRLAFRTSSNQLFIVRSALVVTNLLAPANLAVIQSAAQDFSTTDTIRFTMTVTNRGPANASNVLLAISPPSPISSLSIQVSQGSSTNRGNYYVCNFGSLAAGQSVWAILSAVITNTGTYSNLASVTSATPDPDLSNNKILSTLTGLFFQRPDSVRIYPASATALAYDPVRQRLFAALGTNQIGWYDPESGALQGTIPVGLTANIMHVTDNAQYLYFAGTATGLVQRLDLASLTVDLSFTPPPGALYSWAMTAMPGNPHLLALTFSDATNTYCAAFDDGVPRSGRVSGQYFKLLAAANDGFSLYGYDNSSTGGNSPDVFHLTISTNGLHTAGDRGPSDVPWGNNGDMKYASNRLFFENGNVLNPVTWIEETAFALPNWGSGMDLMPSLDRAAFLTQDFNNGALAHVGIYSISTRQLLQQLDMPGYQVDNLVWCGADRLAFRTFNSIVFLRASSIPAADIRLQCLNCTNQVMLGTNVTVQWIVSNAGPYTASSVVLTNQVPGSFNILSVSVSQGTVSTNGNLVVASLAALNTNATAAVNLVLSPNGSMLGWTTNPALARATAPADPVPFNNSLNQFLLITPLDSDRDGMPDAWELAYGLNPNDSTDAQLDADHDGITNLQEFQAGTNPLIFDELFIAAVVEPPVSGFLNLVIHTPVGTSCTLESSTNLIDWTSSITFVCSSSNQTILVTTPKPPAFYRLRR